MEQQQNKETSALINTDAKDEVETFDTVAEPADKVEKDVSRTNTENREFTEEGAVTGAPENMQTNGTALTEKMAPGRGRNLIIRVCVTGAMVALSIIFCRLLGFPQNGIWRVDFGFLPIAIIGMMWGPVWSGMAYGASDLIGAAVTTGVNPLITLEKVLVGVVMGIFFRSARSRHRIGLVPTLACFAVVAVLLDFLMMAVIFRFGFGYTWSAALLFRGANATANFALRCIVMVLCDLRLTSALMREGDKYGV